MYRPSVSRPGRLSEVEVRELWRLRTSLLPLKPDIDPERDYDQFADFIRRCHVGRVHDGDGRVVATMSNFRLDGRFEGRSWRLTVYEYAFCEAEARSHPALVVMYMMLFYGCVRWRPRVDNLLCFAGYPKTVLTYSKRVPALKLDGSPTLDPLERHLIERYVDELLSERFDSERRIVSMPTRPPQPRLEWLAKNADDPLLLEYLERSPQWTRGESLIAISRLDGGLRLVSELAARGLDSQARRLRGFIPWPSELESRP